MLAYTMGITKEEFVAETLKHQAADIFIKNTYWKNGKGCAVGCAIESINKLKGLKLEHSEHNLFEKHLGIPQWLAEVEDTVFEGVSLDRSKKWPVEFAKAINTGANLDNIKIPFKVFILENNIENLKNIADADCVIIAKVIEANQQVIKALQSRNIQQLEATQLAAKFVAESFGELSFGSAAFWAAWSAVWAASWYDTGSTATAARHAARLADHEKFANKLLDLLRICK